MLLVTCRFYCYSNILKTFHSHLLLCCMHVCVGVCVNVWAVNSDSIQMRECLVVHTNHSPHKRKIFLGVFFERLLFVCENGFVSQTQSYNRASIWADQLHLKWMLNPNRTHTHAMPFRHLVEIHRIFRLCVDLWPLKLIFLLFAPRTRHCLLNVKQNNWTTTFQSATNHFPSRIDLPKFSLMAGQRNAFRLI